MANETPHGVRPNDADLPTELSKTLTRFSRFPDGTTTYDLTIPVYGDRPTFSAKEYSDGEVEGTIALYKSGDEHQTMAVGVMARNPYTHMGLPITRYGDTLEIPSDLQALKFTALFMTFRNREPMQVMGRTLAGDDIPVPDIGYSVFTGERLSENHYFYYVMRFILGKVSQVKAGLHIDNNGMIGRFAMVSE